MRILHLVTRSQRRGAELVAVELARGLDALGHTNQVLALGLGFDGSEDVDLPPLTRRTDGGLRALRLGARALRRQLKREPVDIVMAHGGRAVEAAVLVRRRGHPLVVWQRILGFPPLDLATGLAVALARGGAPHRRRGRAHARPRRRAAAARVRRADLGDPELPRPGAVRGRRPDARGRRSSAPSWASTTASGWSGFVGHLIEQKRPDRALDALETMHALGEPAHLVVAGDGPLRARFEQDVAAPGPRGRACTCSAPATTSRTLLAAIDVLILTSDSEGLPGVLIEAQMAGCPIVTVPVGGVRDLVDDGETGVVTEEIDQAELAGRVVDLLRDPLLRGRLGERARRRAVRFSSSRAAGTYAARLAEIAGSGTGLSGRRLLAESARRPVVIPQVSCNYVRILREGWGGHAQSAFPLVDAQGGPRQDLSGGRTDLACQPG